MSSEKPGMGKSLHVKKLAEKLKDKGSYCIVPVHGPIVDFNTVMKLLHRFTPSYESLTPQIIHMDIDSEVIKLSSNIYRTNVNKFHYASVPLTITEYFNNRNLASEHMIMYNI